jgi:hypothetical protein
LLARSKFIATIDSEVSIGDEPNFVSIVAENEVGLGGFRRAVEAENQITLVRGKSAF